MSPHVLGVPAYPAAQLIGMALALVFAYRRLTATGLPSARAFAAVWVLGLAAVGGAVLSAPSFRPTAGFRYPGVGVAVVAALPIVRWTLGGRLTLLGFGDVIAAPLAFGLAGAKLACFFHGCCHGPPSNVPWAVTFPQHSLAWWHQLDAGLIVGTAEQSLPVHPLQLYCVAWACAVGWLLMRPSPPATREGQPFLLLLALVTVGYFVAERFQVPRNPATQLGSLVAALVAALLYLVLDRSARAQGTSIRAEHFESSRRRRFSLSPRVLVR